MFRKNADDDALEKVVETFTDVQKTMREVWEQAR